MKRHKVRLSVEFGEGAGESTPVRTEVDFDSLLGPRGGLVDPHTLVVRRRLAGRTRAYPVQFSESLYYGNSGWIAWLVDRRGQGGEWWLEFAPRKGDGELAKAPPRPQVGVGDQIYRNGRRWQPLDVPGFHPFPIAADWDGDGRIDLLSTSHHTNNLGMLWAGVFF